MKVLACAAQFEPKPKKEETLERALYFIEQAGRFNAGIICLNDYLLSWPVDSSHSRDFVANWAEPIPGPTTDFFSREAEKRKMMICTGTFLEKSGSNYHLSSVLIDSTGKIIGVHRKNFLLNGGLKLEKDSGITPGTEDPPVYDTRFGKVGLLLDSESYDPNNVESLIKKKPDLVFFPVSWSVRVTMGSFGDLQVMARHISRQGNSFVIATNKVGLRQAPTNYVWSSQGITDGNNSIDVTPLNQVLYSGGSMILSRKGGILSVAQDYVDDMAVAIIDLPGAKA